MTHAPPPTDDPVLAAREAAETVRRHLVRLRGGAPFLSAADGALLVRWLDDGVPLHRILRGLEAAAAARMKRRARSPLTLRHARRHLGRPRATRLPSAPPAPVVAEAHTPDHPLAGLIATLRASPLATACPGPVEDAARDLLAVEPAGPDPATEAIDRLGALWEAAWLGLDDAGRAPYLEEAVRRLGDLLEDADDGERAVLLETWGRAVLRDQAPGCTASAIVALLETP